MYFVAGMRLGGIVSTDKGSDGSVEEDEDFGGLAERNGMTFISQKEGSFSLEVTEKISYIGVYCYK